MNRPTIVPKKGEENVATGKSTTGSTKAKAVDNVTVIVSRTVAEQMFLALSKALAGGGGKKKKKGAKKTTGKIAGGGKSSKGVRGGKSKGGKTTSGRKGGKR